MSIGPVLHSFSYALQYLHDQVADISDSEMMRQPAGVPNHPAWTIGHLVFIAQAIGEVAGVEPWLDDEWVRAFGPGSVPTDAPTASPAKEELLSALSDAERRLKEAVIKLDDTALDAPFPDPEYAYVFPTIRHAFTQVLAGHTAFHVGQIAVWRRAMGLPSIGRSFE